MEEWKDIKGYEGIYQISNKGRVKSLKFNKVKILKLSSDTNGYKKINLFKNSKQKTYLIHRLVAEHFIPNPDNLPEINHKDENKNNNNVENLEWCTREYNNNYGTRVEKMIKKYYEKNNKKYFKNIKCVESNEIFNGSKDIIDKIINCCENNESIFGYHFKFIDE